MNIGNGLVIARAFTGRLCHSASTAALAEFPAPGKSSTVPLDPAKGRRRQSAIRNSEPP